MLIFGTVTIYFRFSRSDYLSFLFVSFFRLVDRRPLYSWVPCGTTVQGTQKKKVVYIGSEPRLLRPLGCLCPFYFILFSVSF